MQIVKNAGVSKTGTWHLVFAQGLGGRIDTTHRCVSLSTGCPTTLLRTCCTFVHEPLQPLIISIRVPFLQPFSEQFPYRLPRFKSNTDNCFIFHLDASQPPLDAGTVLFSVTRGLCPTSTYHNGLSRHRYQHGVVAPVGFSFETRKIP